MKLELNLEGWAELGKMKQRQYKFVGKYDRCSREESGNYV